MSRFTESSRFDEAPTPFIDCRAVDLMLDTLTGKKEPVLDREVVEHSTPGELARAMRQGAQYIVDRGQITIDDGTDQTTAHVIGMMVDTWNYLAVIPEETISESPMGIVKGQYWTCLRDVSRLSRIFYGQAAADNTSAYSGSGGMDTRIPRMLIENIIARGRTGEVRAWETDTSTSSDFADGVVQGSKFVVNQRWNASDAWLNEMVHKWNIIGQCGPSSIIAAPIDILKAVFLDCARDVVVLSAWLAKQPKA